MTTAETVVVQVTYPPDDARGRAWHVVLCSACGLVTQSADARFANRIADLHRDVHDDGGTP